MRQFLLQGLIWPALQLQGYKALEQYFIETGADRVRLEYATWAIMNKGAAVDQAAN